MATIITPVAAVDAIQRVPVECWIGPFDNGGNGFPNYPIWCNADGQAVELLDDATHAKWDGAFGTITAQLIDAIGQDPSLVPVDTSQLDRATLLALYPDAAKEPEIVRP